jgi:crotonobetaine/carnitine-CoA ligase
VVSRESLWEIIGRRARETPRENLIVEADGSAITYGDAVGIIPEWADRLGAPPGRVARRVGAVAPNSASLHLLRLACGQAGAVFVALNPLLKGLLLRDAIVRSALTDLVVSPETAAGVAAIRAELPAGLATHVLDGGTFRTGPGPLTQRGKAAERDPRGSQILLYTSGTTGPAKPVRLTSRSILSYASRHFGDHEPAWTPGAGYYSPWHPAHVLGAVALDVAVIRGLTLVVRRKFSQGSFWPDVLAHDCEATTLVTVADDIWAQRASWQSRNPLRLMGMSPLVADVPGFERYFGVEVVSVYGMTEVGTALAARSPADSRVTGWPVRGYQCRLVDVPGIEAVAGRTSRIGELIVRPDFGTSEYDQAVEPGTGGWEDGWFHTGDLFTEFEGAYSFVGRIKDSIRRHGRNISAVDLESAVRALSEVADCACVGVQDPDPGGRPVADEEIRVFVVARPGRVIDPERFVSRLAECLPAFMLPRYVDVVPELPSTFSGKVSRQALRLLPVRTSTYDRKRLVSLRGT